MAKRKPAGVATAEGTPERGAKNENGGKLPNTPDEKKKSKKKGGWTLGGVVTNLVTLGMIGYSFLIGKNFYRIYYPYLQSQRALLASGEGCQQRWHLATTQQPGATLQLAIPADAPRDMPRRLTALIGHRYFPDVDEQTGRPIKKYNNIIQPGQRTLDNSFQCRSPCVHFTAFPCGFTAFQCLNGAPFSTGAQLRAQIFVSELGREPAHGARSKAPSRHCAPGGCSVRPRTLPAPGRAES